MTTMYDFGVRATPPCGDCYEDGHCSMNCGSFPHTMGKIITTFVDPPIPIRSFDWQAYYDGDEPDDNGNMVVGHGKTECDAIEDLYSK